MSDISLESFFIPNSSVISEGVASSVIKNVFDALIKIIKTTFARIVNAFKTIYERAMGKNFKDNWNYIIKHSGSIDKDSKVKIKEFPKSVENDFDFTSALGINAVAKLAEEWDTKFNVGSSIFLEKLDLKFADGTSNDAPKITGDPKTWAPNLIARLAPREKEVGIMEVISDRGIFSEEAMCDKSYITKITRKADKLVDYLTKTSNKLRSTHGTDDVKINTLSSALSSIGSVISKTCADATAEAVRRSNLVIAYAASVRSGKPMKETNESMDFSLLGLK